MASSFGTDGYIGITPQQSPSPSPMTTRSNRHGSAEPEQRDVFGRYAPFRSTETPRTPRRARSPGDDEDRRQDRADWRERRQQEVPQGSGEPLAFNLRLLAIERTLKEHFAEISNHKKFIDESRPVLKGLTEMEGRLDRTFADWNNRITGIDKSNGMAMQGLRDEISNVVGSASNRIDLIEVEFRKLIGRMDEGMPQPPGIPSHPQAPPMPQTWSPLSAPPSAPDPWHRPSATEATTNDTAWSQWRPAAPSQTTGPQLFGMSSPSTAAGGGWAAGFGTNVGPWAEKDWKVDNKVSSELKVFDGQIQHYANWRNRIRDHFISTNVYYCEVFDLIESTKSILTLRTLNDARVPSLPNVNWRWLASHLWTFLGRWMNNTQLDRRITLASG